MPYNIRKISEQDLNKRQKVGLKYPFSAGNVFNSTTETLEALKYNILNYFLTGVNERPLNPNFGAGLQNLIFEQGTLQNLNGVKIKIEEDLRVNFPQLKINKLEVEYITSLNAVQITVTYKMINYNLEDTLTLNIELN